MLVRTDPQRLVSLSHATSFNPRHSLALWRDGERRARAMGELWANRRQLQAHGGVVLH